MPETRNTSAGSCQAGAGASPQCHCPELFSAPGLDPVQLEHQRHCRSCPRQVRWFKYLSTTTATTGLQLKQTNHRIYSKGKGTPATLSLSTEQCRYELQKQVRGEAILKWRANYLLRFKLNRITPQCNGLQRSAYKRQHKPSKTTFKTCFNRSHFYPHLPRYLFQHLMKLSAPFPSPDSCSKRFQTWLAPRSPALRYAGNTVNIITLQH